MPGIMAIVGLALPAKRGAGGYFSEKRDIDLMWGDILLAIMCPIGGCFMKRASFGSSFYNCMFEPADSVAASLVESAVKQAVAKNVRNASVTEVLTSFYGKQMSVSVTFKIGLTSETRTVQVDRKTTIQYLSARRK